MKFKKNIFYGFLIMAVVLSATSVIYANSGNGKQAVKTEQEKKIEIMLDDAYSNLKETFGIDEKSYVKIKYDSLDELNNGKIAEFKDKKFGSEAALLIHNARQDFPLGYTIPVIYIKNDRSEIILCAKNEAGESKMITLQKTQKTNSLTTNNTLTTSNDNAWNKNIVQGQGKPNLKIKDIQLNNN